MTVTRIRSITTLAIVMLFCSCAFGQQSTNLTPGLNQERLLGPADNHIYTINLSEGAAVLGEADQRGVDLVIDIFGPDGKLIRTVDSPNGTEGPEPH